MWSCRYSHCKINKTMLVGFKVNDSESVWWLGLKQTEFLSPVKSQSMPCQDRLYGRETAKACECRRGESTFGL